MYYHRIDFWKIHIRYGALVWWLALLPHFDIVFSENKYHLPYGIWIRWLFLGIDLEVY